MLCTVHLKYSKLFFYICPSVNLLKSFLSTFSDFSRLQLFYFHSAFPCCFDSVWIFPFYSVSLCHFGLKHPKDKLFSHAVGNIFSSQTLIVCVSFKDRQMFTNWAFLWSNDGVVGHHGKSFNIWMSKSFEGVICANEFTQTPSTNKKINRKHNYAI